ncbi:hypothetical protein [Absidia glauca]|uniref:Uncharacterized protein n=1 Tax=Absidia glauca TaxID=4829 RepID=A0A163JGM4_ABSGL|nr:hypothetical protein [Absidia glauca]
MRIRNCNKSSSRASSSKPTTNANSPPVIDLDGDDLSLPEFGSVNDPPSPLVASLSSSGTNVWSREPTLLLESNSVRDIRVPQLKRPRKSTPSAPSSSATGSKGVPIVVPGNPKGKGKERRQ